MLPANWLDPGTPGDRGTYEVPQISTPICICASNGQAVTKKTVLLLQEGAEHGHSVEPLNIIEPSAPAASFSSVSDRGGPVGPQGLSSHSTSYLDIGIPAFL